MPLLISLSPPCFKDMAHRWWAPSGIHCWHKFDSVIIAKRRERGFSLSLACSLAPCVSHPVFYLSFLHTHTTNSWVDGYTFVRTYNNFTLPHMRWMVWDKCGFQMYALLTLHRAPCLFCFSCRSHTVSSAKEKQSNGTNNTILCNFFVFLLWKSPTPAGWTFPPWSLVWMRVMPAVFSPPHLPTPTWDACCSVAEPWRWITAEELPALPFTHFTHTHHLSIIGLICWGSSAHTHTGLKALTGLLAKGQCQESDKSFLS